MTSLFPVPRPWGVVVGIGIILVIAYGSLMPNPPSLDVDNGDKWQHLAGYALLAGWWAIVLPKRWLAVLLAAAAYGVLIEYLQGMTSYRSFDVLDMAANALGASLGVGAAHAAGAWGRSRLSRKTG
ncbi:VanZ family protein [Chitinimonas naiadis]